MEAINLLQKAYLSKNFESIYKNRLKKLYKFTPKSWFRWKKWKIMNSENYEKISKSYIKMDKKKLKNINWKIQISPI